MSLSNDEATLAKRQRVSRACDLCRKKKIKCDGELPVCNNCQSLNLECTYKDTTKKRGPPKGYIEAIENRLQKLEGYLNSISENKDKDDPKLKEILQELQSPLETSFGEQINTRPQRRRQRTKQKDTVEHKTSGSSPLIQSPTLSHSDLPETPTEEEEGGEDGAAGQLTMDENGQVRYLGKSSGFYLLSNSRTYQNGAFHFSGYHHKKIKSGKRKYPVDPFELPPNDLSEHLISLYLTHFYPVLPMFYKKRLVCPNNPLAPISPLLLNAIYAIASRISTDIRVRSDPTSPDTAGDVFFERARCLLDDYYDTPKISTVQALLLLASHQMGAMKAARAWLYSGMAFRMAQDLGLNRNCDHWNILPAERERRKRVFWCCFIVDRLTSAIYGRSSNFEEKDCDAPFPSVDDDEPIVSTKDPSRPPASLLEAFIESIKFNASSQHADQILTTLSRQLTQWHTKLPLSLQYKLPNTQIGEKGPDPPAPICQLHLIYYTTVILLHRSFMPGPVQAKPLVSQPCYKICLSAALSILDIVNIMLDENHLRCVYNFAVYFVFTAGIIFIKTASFGDPYDAFEAKININKIMRALDELEMTWLNAARCCNILGELAGLRDIKLESNEYVPKKESKPTPPPAIAVPNSPENNKEDMEVKSNELSTSKEWDEDKSKKPEEFIDLPLFSSSSQMPISSVRGQHRSPPLSTPNDPYPSSSSEKSSFLNSTSTMDPFAAPDIIPTHSVEQTPMDTLATAFWGMPTSLDTNEWNAYFGNLNSQNNTNNNNNSNQITSLFLSNNDDLTSPITSSSSSSPPFMMGSTSKSEIKSRSLLSNSLSLDLPSSPSKSVLLGFLDNTTSSTTPIYMSSPTSIHPSNSFDSNTNDTTTTSTTKVPSSSDVLYW
ncbi:hypothetical protein G6F57_007457 [Rhizopus arrhizus]|uniref:Zn(2)-C6 fungal-type domain-containing protein n=1 Tax=Rhizopus oryzae TaxID=64495 RepID=A0A9P6X9R6_RHIOR|nr:hypothetical protein G6F23_004024 [Rhizopus arrhizus]KAG1415041.1 hypothetical protein G6F58_006668 [Rhizopus delemar]KAG0760629.1 hypothetical protein G6F24_008176 [Rhizopus arrhizus]KAG0786963.1 hypothetical protein G6F21_008223 [Rhizopus arrhizus]KAG0816281.1 hypothetical protein G6F20_003334 [Rhizopus arrhizus]